MKGNLQKKKNGKKITERTKHNLSVIAVEVAVGGGSWGMKQERRQPSCDWPAISQAASQLIFRYAVHSFNLTGFSPPLLVYFFISFFFKLSFFLFFFVVFFVRRKPIHLHNRYLARVIFFKEIKLCPVYRKSETNKTREKKRKKNEKRERKKNTDLKFFYIN